MADPTQEQVSDFLDRTEQLCRAVAERLLETASQGSLKEKLLKMADEAADLSSGVGGSSTSGDIVILKTSDLLEAIR